MDDTPVAFYIIGGIVVAILLLIVYALQKSIDKGYRDRLTPKKVELELALKEVNRASTNPTIFYEKLIQKYTNLNFEQELKCSEVFVPVLLKQTSKILLLQNNYVNLGNYKIIKVILENDFSDHITYSIIKTLLVKLILDEEFDLQKYKLLFCIHYKINDIENNELAADLRLFFDYVAETEYREIMRKVNATNTMHN